MSTGFKLLLFVALLFGAFWAYQWRMKDMRVLLVDGFHGPRSASNPGPTAGTNERPTTPERSAAWQDVSPDISPVPRVLEPITSNVVRVRWRVREEEQEPAAPLEDPRQGEGLPIVDPEGQSFENVVVTELPGPRFTSGRESDESISFHSGEDREFAELKREENMVHVNLVRADEPAPDEPEQRDAEALRRADKAADRADERKSEVQVPPVGKNMTEIVHVVVEGETLWKIAEHYLGKGYRANKLVDWNPDRIKDSGVVRTGTKLRVRLPLQKTRSDSRKDAAKRVIRTEKNERKNAAKKDRESRTSKAPRDTARRGVLKTVTHEVKKGDTLAKLARRYFGGEAGPESWRRIFDANRSLIKDPHRLTVGKRLTIPVLADGTGGPSAGKRAKNS